MEAFIQTAFLEELVYESDAACTVSQIFQRVEERGIKCDESVKTFIWPTLRKNDGILFISNESCYNSWHQIDMSEVPTEWTAEDSNRDDWKFNKFKILAGYNLRVSILNLWEKPEIYKVPIRLHLLSIIVSKRHEGCWQFELSRVLGIPPKTLFQHLKPFYRYNIIVRFNLPLPQRIRRQGNISGSGILWFPRFFDVRLVPRDLLQMMYTQQSVPLARRFIQLLKTVTNNIVLESDLRALCLSFFVQPGHPQLLCSLKTAGRYYAKLRRDLILSKQVARVKAWCPQTKKFESSLVLFGQENSVVIEDRLYYKDQEQASDVKKAQFSHFDLRQRSIGEAEMEGNPNLSESEETDEDDPNVKHIGLEVEAMDTATLLEQQRLTPKESSVDDGIIDNKEIASMPLITTDDGVDHEDTPMTDFVMGGLSINEIPINHQMLCFIHSSGSEGVLTTQIASLVGITSKRLMRQLQALENSKLIYRKAQRIGKHFVYKYFSNMMEKTSSFHIKEEPIHGVVQSGVLSLSKETLQAATASSSTTIGVPSTPRTDGRNSILKTQTEQFTTRLGQLKEWIEEAGACVLPDLVKRFATVENSKGMDRRTVQRLLSRAMTEDFRVQVTELLKGRMRSQPVTVIYWSERYTSAEAKEFVEHAITKKRSEGCRDAIQKNIELLKVLNQKALSASPDTIASDSKEESQSQVEPLDQESVMKAAALNELTHKMEKYAATENPVNRFHPESQVVLTNLHVEKRPERRLCSGAQSLIYSQKILAHYGFVFALMIRLKIFHRYLIDISFPLPGSQLSSPSTTSEMTPSLDETHETGFSPLYLIRKMPIDTFLRTVGCGYQYPIVDQYLRSTTDHNTPMESLQSDVYDSLIKTPIQMKSGRGSSRSAVPAIKRLLEKLALMKAVEEVHIPLDKEQSGCDGPVHLKWRVFSIIRLHAFTDSSTTDTNLVGVYDMSDSCQFEAYWRNFKGEVDRWRHFHAPEACRLQLKNGVKPDIVTESIETSSVLVQSKDEFHIRHRKKRRIELEDKNEEEERMMKEPKLKSSDFQIPVNMPLASAFSKKNWKGQILLSPKVRTELEAFAQRLVHRFSNCTTATDQETPPNICATIAVLSAAREITTTTNVDEQTLLTPQTPEIRHLSNRLRIPTDSVIRYLLRYLYTSDQDHVFLSERSPLVIHTVRDLRYAKHKAIEHHYSAVHGRGLPEATSVYMLRAEYRKRLDHLKNQFILCNKRRRRSKRIEFGKSAFLSSEFPPSINAIEQDKEMSAAQDTNMMICDASTLNVSIETNAENLKSLIFIKRFISNLRREDEFIFLGIAVVAERLYMASTKGFEAKDVNDNEDDLLSFLLPATEFLTNNTLPLTTADHHQQASAQVSVFGKHLTKFPQLAHKIWTLMLTLCPPRLELTSNRIRLLLQFLLERSHANRNLRIFNNYRRLSADDLESHLSRTEIPTANNFIRPIALADGAQKITFLCSDDNRKIQILMWRNILKTIVLSPLLSYRPHWAFQAASSLREPEIRTIWSDWNMKGWVVQAKSVTNEKKPILQRKFEAKCMRKFCVSRGARVAILGKIKELLFMNDVERELKQFNTDVKKGQKEGDCSSPSKAVEISDVPMLDLTLGENNSSISKVCITEPISGPFVAAILEELVQNKIALKLRWHDQTSFDDVIEKVDDEKLFDLLLKDVRGLTTEKSKGVVDFAESFSGSEESEDAGLERMLMMLEDDRKQGSDLHKERWEPTKSSDDESFRLSEEEDEEEEARSEACLTNNDKKARYGLPLPLRHHDQHHLDGRRVLARAIEGGVERHILQLTADVSDVADVIAHRLPNESITIQDFLLTQDVDVVTNEFESDYRNVNNGFATSTSQFGKSIMKSAKHGRSFDTSAELSSNKRARLNERGRMNKFKLLLDGNLIKRDVGCFHQGDPPDPQLFSNLVAEHLSTMPLSTKNSTKMPLLPWRCDDGVSNFNFIPIYSDDLQFNWNWNDLLEEENVISISPSMTPTPHCETASDKRKIVGSAMVESIKDQIKETLRLCYLQKESNSGPSLQETIGDFRSDNTSQLSDNGPTPSSADDVVKSEVNKLKSSPFCQYFHLSNLIIFSLNSIECLRGGGLILSFTKVSQNFKIFITSNSPNAYEVFLEETSTFFFQVAGFLSSLLVEELQSENILQIRTGSMTACPIAQRNKRRAFDCLIWLLLTIHLKKELGVREKDLESDFYKVWEKGFRLCPNTGKLKPNKDEDILMTFESVVNETIREKEGDSSSSKASFQIPFSESNTTSSSPLSEVDSFTFNKNLFEKLIWILESLQLIVRIPYLDTWRYVSSLYSQSYCLQKRRILKYGVSSCDVRFNHDCKEEPLERQTVYNTNSEESTSVANAVGRPLTGSFDCPSYVPMQIWCRWGCPNDLQVNRFFSHLIDDQMIENEADLDAFVNALDLRSLLIIVCRLVLVPVVSLLTVDQTGNEYPYPLRPFSSPACGWIQIDGHINQMLLAFLNARLWNVSQENPKATSLAVSCYKEAISIVLRDKFVYFFDAQSLYQNDSKSSFVDI